MYSGDLGKPYGRWNSGPETAPGVKLAYHGQGTEHQLVYTSNPVSWLVTLQHCIPFLSVNSANLQSPAEELSTDSAVSDQVDLSQLGPTGSRFDVGQLLPPPPMPGGVVSPRQDLGGTPLAISGFAANGIPLATVVAPTPSGGEVIGGRNVALWGSRKTAGIPLPNTSPDLTGGSGF